MATAGRPQHSLNQRLQQCRVQDFRRVQGMAPGAVLDLVAAAGAGGAEERVGGGGADGGEEDEFADLL